MFTAVSLEKPCNFVLSIRQFLISVIITSRSGEWEITMFRPPLEFRTRNRKLRLIESIIIPVDANRSKTTESTWIYAHAQYPPICSSSTQGCPKDVPGKSQWDVKISQLHTEEVYHEPPNLPRGLRERIPRSSKGCPMGFSWDVKGTWKGGVKALFKNGALLVDGWKVKLLTVEEGRRLLSCQLSTSLYNRHACYSLICMLSW